MLNVSVVTRISLGLVLMTISILLIADMTGVLPNENKSTLDYRKKTCETLAVQLSWYAETNNTKGLKTIMRAVVERNDDILSAAMRRNYDKNKSTLIAATSEHQKLWAPPANGKSTPTHAQIPIFKGDNQWGTVELRFTPINTTTVFGLNINPVYKLLAFVALFGFMGYMFFMRRTLKHLDPTAIIPSRVKYALDALSEGIILMDKQGRIVLANNTFAESAGKEDSELMGKKPSDWDWKKPYTDKLIENTPWMDSINTNETYTGVPMSFSKQDDDAKTYMVNSSPILGADGKIKGALATFDDVTQLEEKNNLLEKTLQLLELSHDEINQKNERLQVLASHDPLTGCLNRRAFFEKFESDIAKAKRGHKNICCIMADIDHFKCVNDTFGHSEGDKILKEVSQKLKEELRKGDLLCRYGGEEFCLMLWDTNIARAAEIAERIRLSIAGISNCKIRVTSSFGVSSRLFGATTPEELIHQADEALYKAKETGRNRIVRCDDFTINPAANEELQVPDSHDPVTGCLNRDAFLEQFKNGLAEAKRSHKNICCIMTDIDHFKCVNDTFGHAEGDKILKEVSQKLKKDLGENDLLCRYSDEEFCLVLWNTNIAKAAEIAERIRLSIAGISNCKTRVTSSFGVSSRLFGATTAEELIHQADQVLYKAKEDGHNRVVRWDNFTKKPVTIKEQHRINTLR